MQLTELDAVTIDGHGTLLELRDPFPALERLLPGYDRAAIERAFDAEAQFYVPRSHEGRDEASLARLRAECTDVFNRTLGSALTPGEYVGALEFDFVPGALEAVRVLHARGLALAVVANWDISLVQRLGPLRIPVVTSAEAGVAKPDPRIFELALARLGVAAERALHVGNHRNDEEGAAAAGMRFAWAPLGKAVAQWT
jgi:FMN phosphatase YigB (HAD superfamily)